MPEEATTPDLVERVRASIDAFPDLDAMMSFFTPGAVWEAVDLGTSFAGARAISVFLGAPASFCNAPPTSPSGRRALISRTMAYLKVDEARAAAERLAESRG